jgi:hypothetical protein
VVEGVSGRGDSAFHVGPRTVGCGPDDLLRRGVDVVELTADLGFDKLAVDQHAGFVGHH